VFVIFSIDLVRLSNLSLRDTDEVLDASSSRGENGFVSVVFAILVAERRFFAGTDGRGGFDFLVVMTEIQNGMLFLAGDLLNLVIRA
jgi:hypothetical protein